MYVVKRGMKWAWPLKLTRVLTVKSGSDCEQWHLAWGSDDRYEIARNAEGEVAVRRDESSNHDLLSAIASFRDSPFARLRGLFSFSRVEIDILGPDGQELFRLDQTERSLSTQTLSDRSGAIVVSQNGMITCQDDVPQVIAIALEIFWEANGGTT